MRMAATPIVMSCSKKQAEEWDRKQRAVMLHDIQRLRSAKVIYAPLFDLAFPCVS